MEACKQRMDYDHGCFSLAFSGIYLALNGRVNIWDILDLDSDLGAIEDTSAVASGAMQGVVVRLLGWF